MQENIKPIQVKMTDRRYVRTEPIYQYDVGHTLDLSVFAAMLPETFQVHFGRSLMGDSITQIGQNCSCPVPDMYAQTAAPIYAWLYIPETETGLTKYTIEIPVQRRARITNQEPTPVERSAIDQEIAALNAGVERAEDAAEAAEAAQAGAEAAEQGASAAEDSAGASAALAAQKAELATREAGRAQAAEGIVEQAARDAVEDVTEVAEQAAADLGGIVREAQTQIAGSVQQAQQAAQAASGSATAAAGSAGAAAGSATAADQSAQAAAQKKEQMDVRADEIEEEFTSLKSDIAAKPEIDDTAGEGVTDKTWSADKIVTELQDKADVIISSASGAIASFPDGAAAPVEKLAVNVEPVQDLHGQDAPYPPGGGKNLLPPVLKNDQASITTNGVTLTVVNQKFHLQGTGTSNGGRNILRTENISLQAGTYTLVGDAIAMKADSTLLSSTFTLGEATDVYIGFNVVNGTSYNEDRAVCIVEGSTAIAWSPYENICPISGWTEANVARTGKNLFDETDEASLIDVFGIDGNLIKRVGYEIHLPTGTYTWSAASKEGLGAFLYVNIINADGSLNEFAYFVESTTVRNKTFTLTDGQFVILYDAQVDQEGAPTKFGNFNIQLELGSNATDYESYSGQTYPITIPADPGIVYGGKLTVNRDGTGSLVAELAEVDMGSLVWQYFSDTTPTHFRATVTGLKRATDNIFCSAYEVIKGNPYANKDKTIRSTDQHNAYGIKVSDTAYTDAASFKAAVTGQQLVYELATPLTYTLTAAQVTTILGTNNVWSDAGEVEVTYRADTKLYIDNKLAELVAQIVNS